MATVEIIEVSKQYGPTFALQDVNLSVEKGEFVAVVGSSGSGKSTLLRLVAGLDSLSSGQILINDNCVNAIHPSKRDIAMVFQNYALYPHMTVFDNLAYSLKMSKLSRQAIDAKVRAAASLLKISDFLERKPSNLSGGQRQRVAMGRAIVRAPAVFLFDEPLSNLDAQLRADMRHEIKKLQQKLNTTCLYVTHDQTEAMTMASRIVVLHQGKVEQIASPETLYEKPESLFVAGFIGQYPMNLLKASICQKSQKITSVLGLEFPKPDHQLAESELIISLRAEHLLLRKRGEAGSLPVLLDCIDNMGADKLVRVKSLCGMHTFCVRVLGTTVVDNELGLAFQMDKANFYLPKTGKRIKNPESPWLDHGVQ